MKKLRFIAAAVLLLAGVSAWTSLWAQAPRITAILAGHLINTVTGVVVSKQVVLIEGERITEVGPQDRVAIPKGATVIDLNNSTVLPGLIDCHTHIFPSDVSTLTTTREYRTLVALSDAQADLRAGFTTLRDLMSHGGGYADVDVRNAVNAGLAVGPRMQVATMGVGITGSGLPASPRARTRGPAPVSQADYPCTGCSS